MSYIVYKTTNQVNDKIYVGVHHTENPDVFDGYLGSGKVLLRAIKKHGFDNFKRETLAVFDESEDAYSEECRIVDREFIERKDTYNLLVGGQGCAGGIDHPNYGKHHSEETRNKLSITKLGNKNPMYGKSISKEHRRNLCLARVGKQSPMLGKHHSEETKQTMRENRKGENCYWFGKKRSPETIRKLQIAKSGDGNHMYGKHHSNITKQKMRDSHLPSVEFVNQRRLDIQNEVQTWGWKTRLSQKWSVGKPAVGHFIRKHASDLVNEVV